MGIYNNRYLTCTNKKALIDSMMNFDFKYRIEITQNLVEWVRACYPDRKVRVWYNSPLKDMIGSEFVEVLDYDVMNKFCGSVTADLQDNYSKIMYRISQLKVGCDVSNYLYDIMKYESSDRDAMTRFLMNISMYATSINNCKYSKERLNECFRILIDQIIPFKAQACSINEDVCSEIESTDDDVNVFSREGMSTLFKLVAEWLRHTPTKESMNNVATLLTIIYSNFKLPASTYANPFYVLLDINGYDSVELKTMVKELELNPVDLLNAIDAIVSVDSSYDQVIRYTKNRIPQRVIHNNCNAICNLETTNSVIIFGDNIYDSDNLHQFIIEVQKANSNLIKRYVGNESGVSFVMSEDDMAFLSYELKVKKCTVSQLNCFTRKVIAIPTPDGYLDGPYVLFKVYNKDSIFGISLNKIDDVGTRHIIEIHKTGKAKYVLQYGGDKQ